MTETLLPDVGYTQTARRPGWAQLPVELRAAIEDRLGAAVVTAGGTGAGFTQGFASVVGTADGRAHFVKAVPHDHYLARWYQEEARNTAALPAGVATARLRWHAELADHVVLCLDPIPGARVPQLPWGPQELASTLDALAVTATALAEPSGHLLDLPLETFATVADPTLRKWRDADPDQLATLAPALIAHLDRLRELEARLVELGTAAPGLFHGDLRLDNVVLDADGRAWICDWAFLAHGPAWFDLVTLLLSAEASGLDVDALFASHPTARGLPADALDAALAACVGYYVHAGAQPEIEQSPAIRSHQRYYGRLALRWLTRRQGWR
ncbi:phosphotransferase family protein [Catellatospora tritici]|uniref:phosphotransferase family protein n=1 Tax=Catellatospora tritici TaxID=2851566 RepID=UPI001C2CD2C7|nr:phosphotransferase [Catellatospora tritici]MBV1855676.1 aminoglycoside phosphotransferase family protein [Catellatospora tritici]